MHFDASSLTIVFGLAAACAWGASDFYGGLAARKNHAIVVTLFAQITGLALLCSLILLGDESLPQGADIFWSALAGISGMIGVVCLYKALAKGQVSIAAPVSAVISAAFPVVAGSLIQGQPSPIQLVGFVLALLSIWIIYRPNGGYGNKLDILLPVTAGIFLGAFLIFFAQTEGPSIFWSIATARITSITLLFLITLFGKKLVIPKKGTWLMVAVTGVVDVIGNAFFLLAAESGRLDVAGVLSSLYPAATVFLAYIILRERITKLQGLGVTLALVAIPLIAS